MPGTGLPKGERRRRKVSEGGRGNRVREGRRQIVRTWSALLSVAVFAILGVTVWLWLWSNSERELIQGQIAAEVPEDPRKISDFPSPSESEALELVKQALANRDPEKVTRYFRPCATDPRGIVDFLQALDTTDGPVSRMDWLSSLDANNLSLDGVLISFKSSDKPRNRLALLTPDAAGIWRIDFDAFARTVNPSWADLLGGSSETGLVRVYLAPDSYYNGPFGDERQWICYGLASPDTEQILLGYCKSGSPQAAALALLFEESSKIARVTLEIRRVAGAEPRQFEISRILAKDWVMGASPFDERLK